MEITYHGTEYMTLQKTNQTISNAENSTWKAFYRPMHGNFNAND